ncbi:hypothetical protein ILT43_12095 [Sphingomonas sp. BT552]|uniref:Minor tail T domain-containing protein n=1 Tax=Sphingomonas longa TaxID=2778730 RepID=A0ABS2D845_9SPHN|nr:hypothetical protein [Sphingomonas sp. BT552]MBM6577114.1 hypothetical protein [Sphingomonas sp. BT552]
MGLGKTLVEIDHISPEELTGWQAFYELEPWGCLVEDHRTELGLNLLYGINSNPGQKIPRFIDRDPEANKPAEQTPEELEDDIRGFFSGKTIMAEDAVAVEEAVPEPTPKKSKARKSKDRQTGPERTSS